MPVLAGVLAVGAGERMLVAERLGDPAGDGVVDDRAFGERDHGVLLRDVDQLAEAAAHRRSRSAASVPMVA